MFIILIKGLIFKEDKILLIKRSDSKFASYKWDLPGGKLEFTENPVECLKREILEETGLKIDIQDIACVDNSFEERKGKQYVSLIYEGNYIDGTIKLSKEHEEDVWIHPEKALSMDLVYYTKNAIISHLKRKGKM